MTDSSEILEFIKDKHQNKEENCILQYGCSICGTVFDTEQLCDDHLKNCAIGEHEHVSQSETSTCTEISSDQTTKDAYSIPERLEYSYFNVDDLHESDLYLYQQNSELDKNYEVTSKMISENEIFITLPYAKGPELSKKVIDYCDDVSVGVEKYNEECETEYKFQLCTKNVTNNTNKIVVKKLHEMVKKDSIKPVSTNIIVIKKHHQMVEKDSTKPVSITTLNASKKSVEENYAEESDLLNFFETVEQSVPSNKGNDSSTPLSNGKDKNHMSRDVSQSLKQSGEHNTKLGAKEIKKGVLYTQLVKPKEYASKQEVQEAKRKKNKQYMKKHKRKKIQKEMQKLIEKTKQSMDHDESTLHNTETEDTTSQGQKTNRHMYTVISTKEDSSEESDDQDEFKVYDFFDEEEEKIKKHLQKLRERKKEENKKKCCYCDKTFENPIEVLRHKREAHKFKKVTFSREEIEPYLDSNNCTECPLCSKALSKNGYKSVYVRHIMTHCDEYNYKCRICGQAFRRTDHCEAHEKRHVVPLVT